MVLYEIFEGSEPYPTMDPLLAATAVCYKELRLHIQKQCPAVIKTIQSKVERSVCTNLAVFPDKGRKQNILRGDLHNVEVNCIIKNTNQHSA